MDATFEHAENAHRAESAEHQENHENHEEPQVNEERQGIGVGRLLNIVGVGFLVIGAILLLSLSWQFLGPLYRVGMGMLGAGALILLGEYMSHKYQNAKWYGQGLVGGGYALGYFMVYAMQNVHAFRIMDNVVLNLSILGAFNACGILHAMAKKSQVIAMLSGALAYLVIAFNPMTIFSVAACAVIAAGQAYTVSRMRWSSLYEMSCIGNYVIFGLSWFGTAHSSTHPLVYFGLLCALWACNMFAALSLSSETDKHQWLGTMVIIDALLFVFMAMTTLSGQPAPWRYMFLNITGGFYYFIARVFQLRDQGLADACRFTGLTLVTAAVPIEVADDRAVPAVYLLESALLAWAGLKFAKPLFRTFAAMLATLTWFWVMMIVIPGTDIVTVRGITMELDLLIGLLAMAAFGTSMWLFEFERTRSNTEPTEVTTMCAMYFLLATTVAFALPLQVTFSALSTIVWPLAGIALIAAGFKFNNVVYRATGLLFFGGVAVKLLCFDLVLKNTFERSIAFLVSGVSFLLGSYAYGWLGTLLKPMESESAETDEFGNNAGSNEQPRATGVA